MPTRASTRRRGPLPDQTQTQTEIQTQKPQATSSSSFDSDLLEAIEEERLAHLQEAIQQSTPTPNDQDDPVDGEGHGTGDDVAVATAASAAGVGDVNVRANTTNPPTDGARNPVAPGADYSSLRLITRRAPKDPQAVLAGVDITSADLSWTGQDEDPGLDPHGRPWLYPKSKARGSGFFSNLDQFKDEIEERTKGGQGCKAIAEALIEKGVDTSARAVARQRMKWGLRQRAKRKMTEQGLANIRKAHLEQAKRLANQDPAPVKRVRIRVMRKAEITRMTNDGMTAAQIAENLMARGVKLQRGAATVERLRTVWGLTIDGPSQRSLAAIRTTARAQALRHQREQFINIARELGVADLDGWVKAKMDEPVAEDARREYAFKLMGDARPKPLSKAQQRGIAENARRLREQKESRRPTDEGVPAETPGAAGGSARPSQQTPMTPAVAEGTAEFVTDPGAPPAETIELDDEAEGEGEDEDTEDEDTDDDAEQAGDGQESQTPADNQKQTPTATDMEDEPVSLRAPAGQNNEAAQQNEAPPRPPAPTLPTQVTNVTNDPGLQNVVFFRDFAHGGAASRGSTSQPPQPQQQGPPPPPSQQQQQQRPQQTKPYFTLAPPAGFPGRPPSNYAPIAPRPLAMAPLGPLGPPFHPTPPEADFMASFGLYAFPLPQGKPPQKYLTPKGMIRTEGYEYLPPPPPPPPPPPSAAQAPGPVGSIMADYHHHYPHPAAPPRQPGPSPATSPAPFDMNPTLHPSHEQPPPPRPAPSDPFGVPPLYFVPGQDYLLVGGPPPPPAPPPARRSPPPPVSAIPAPPLVMPPEEVARHRAEHKTIEVCGRATREMLDLLAARADGRSAPGSLTGLPPSLRDIEGARERLREAANVLLMGLR